ncbi:TPA: hypothetical protein VBN90_000261 [Streptococcus agalactiae]|uniref:hypothetical protein n=1 Tax=Streptococcus entericus TaxID=155680 RepID=UPI00035CE2D3|nr:hypothetical protein [Streptococcus entericus]HEO8062825.1 hypothetical protein [Streptococcus agalactiae]
MDIFFTEKASEYQLKVIEKSNLKPAVGEIFVISPREEVYDDPRNLTAHTIISTPAVWFPLESTNQSINQWLLDTVNGNPQDYGIELLDKKYK